MWQHDKQSLLWLHMKTKIVLHVTDKDTFGSQLLSKIFDILEILHE